MAGPGVRIVSSTKDSIYIQWQAVAGLSSARDIRGYKIIYQAIGSSYVQQTKLLSRDVNRYDITFLHENTFYNICVRSFLNSTHFVDDPGCVRGSTHTDSLGVAIGSTFGAFLALSFIVLLVFLAKRQHTIQSKKQLGESGADGPEVALDEALLHMSDSIYIQLCRQKPGFLERLREINAETLQQPEAEEQPGGGPPYESPQDDPSGLRIGTACKSDTPHDGDAADVTGFLENCEQNYVLGGVPYDEPCEDGLLKPPAIPGVIMHPRPTSAKTHPAAVQPRRQPVHRTADEPGPSCEMASPTGIASGEHDLTRECFKSART